VEPNKKGEVRGRKKYKRPTGRNAGLSTRPQEGRRGVCFLEMGVESLHSEKGTERAFAERAEERDLNGWVIPERHDHRKDGVQSEKKELKLSLQIHS